MYVCMLYANTYLQDGTTALKSAVQGNHGEVATILVEAGANPNDVYKVGR